MSGTGIWWEYVLRYSCGESQREIAAKVGIDPSAVGRWKESVRPRAEHVVEFARKYQRSPIEAMIHAGYIHADEVGHAIEIAGSMRDVSDAALIDELASRLADFRRILAIGNNAQDWPPAGWRVEDSRMRRVQNGD
jgi:transcriptional regulator with XRE-family HTH domain